MVATATDTNGDLRVADELNAMRGEFRRPSNALGAPEFRGHS